MDQQEKQVTVFLLDTGSADRLDTCLRSVYAQDYGALDVTLLSSRFQAKKAADADGFAAYLAQKLPDLAKRSLPVRVVPFEAEQGVYPGLKKALQGISADYFMILETADALADDTVISTLLQIAGLYHWQAPAVVGRQVFANGETRPTDAQAKILYSQDARALLAALTQAPDLLPLSAALFRRDFFTAAGEDVLDYGRDMGYAAFLRLARKGKTLAGLDRPVTLCREADAGGRAPAQTLDELKAYRETQKALYQKERVPALRAYPRATRAGLLRRWREESRACLLECDRLSDGRDRLVLCMRHPFELLFRRGYGQFLLDVLHKTGPLALLCWCLLRAGGLFTGAAEQAAEILPAAAALLCFGVSAVVGVVDFAHDMVDIWLRALCGETAP